MCLCDEFDRLLSEPRSIIIVFGVVSTIRRRPSSRSAQSSAYPGLTVSLCVSGTVSYRVQLHGRTGHIHTLRAPT